VAWFTAVVLALAVAIPALTRSLWTASLVWGALGAALALVWWGRGQKDTTARWARWAVAGAMAVELADALFGVGPGLPTDGPAALAVAVLLVLGAVTLAWRRGAAAGSLPGYAAWHADLDLRSAVYLVGLGGIALAGERCSSEATATWTPPRSSPASRSRSPGSPSSPSSEGACAPRGKRPGGSGRGSGR
jgi:hypothetical protein